MHPEATRVSCARNAAERIRSGAKVVPLAVGYAAAVCIGDEFILHDIISLIWPAFGVALAILLIHGLRCWPAMPLGTVLVSLFYPGWRWDWSMDHLSGWYGSILPDTVAAVLCAAILAGLGFDRRLSSFRDVYLLLLVGGVAGAALAAVVALPFLLDLGIVGGGIVESAERWWIGDFTGMAVVTPLLLAWTRPTVIDVATAALLKTGGIVILVGLLDIVALNLLGDEVAMLIFTTLALPLVAGAAIIMGIRGATLATFTMFFAPVGILFAEAGGAPPSETGLLMLQTVSIAAVVASLSIAAAIKESSRDRGRLRAIIDDQQELVCRFAPDHAVGFANCAFLTAMAAGTRWRAGDSLMAAFDPEERAGIGSRLAALTRDAPTTRLQQRLPGTGRTIDWSIRAFFSEDGGLAEYQAVGRDVTEILQAREHLAMTAARLQRVTRTANGGGPSMAVDRPTA